MKISDFEYDLPEDRIAKNPPVVRGEAKLITVDRNTGAIADKKYPDITSLLNPGDVLVINDTRVIKARLVATKQNGSTREIVVLEKHGKTDDWHKHKIMYRRKIAVGDVLSVENNTLVVLEILGDGLAIVKSDTDLLELTDKLGTVPLPPYMRRDATEQDIERYQTIWAKENGSVAAPTASLNMTQKILDELKNKGVTVVYATLHVGLGTFMPIRTDNIEDHVMHQEYFEVPASTVSAIQTAKNSGNRVIALGTTITRTLEYCQNDILNNPPADLAGEADIFMYPGYKFKVIDGLITNFHAPHSTVLMLAAAFAGWDNLKNAYQHALANDYKFLSYGDSMYIY